MQSPSLCLSLAKMAQEPKTAKVLRCVLCPATYSVEDVEKGLYFPSTGICYACYKRGQHAPYYEWCFGKPDVTSGVGIARYGYNENVPECSSECPDRHICKVFVKNGREKENQPVHEREQRDKDVLGDVRGGNEGGRSDRVC